MNYPSLNLIVLRFTDLPAAAEFYTSLGFSLVQEQHGNGPQHYSCQLGAVVLELYPAAKLGAVPGNAIFGFNIGSMEQAIKSVELNGGSIISRPASTDLGIRALVSDPGGHRLELVEANHSFKPDALRTQP